MDTFGLSPINDMFVVICATEWHAKVIWIVISEKNIYVERTRSVIRAKWDYEEWKHVIFNTILCRSEWASTCFNRWVEQVLCSKKITSLNISYKCLAIVSPVFQSYVHIDCCICTSLILRKRAALNIYQPDNVSDLVWYKNVDCGLF